jgi:hypothetical protein
MHALEVRHLRRIASLDQHLEPVLHQFHQAAAEHALLPEQVFIRLILERAL